MLGTMDNLSGRGTVAPYLSPGMKISVLRTKQEDVRKLFTQLDCLCKDCLMGYSQLGVVSTTHNKSLKIIQ